MDDEMKNLVFITILCQFPNLLICQITGNSTTEYFHVQTVDMVARHLNLTLPTSVQSVIRLVCRHGNRWIVPSSFPYSTLKDHIMDIKPLNVHGSILTLYMSEERPNRTHLRGLYECCTQIGLGGSEIVTNTPELERRHNQPSCCPCCPWYEQKYCLYSWNNSVPNRSKPIQHNHQCPGSVFIFTGTVTSEAVQLQIVVGEPLLVPCPAPSPDLTFRPSISLKLFPNSPWSLPWFPFTDQHQIAHAYDSRFGLCLTKSEFPRHMPYLICDYPGLDEQRVIQLTWPAPVPTIAPELDIHLMVVGPSHHPDQRHDLFLFTSKPGHIDATVPSGYRVRKATRIRAKCVARYIQPSIVRQPPSRLCFSWNWREWNRTEEIAEEWDLTGCPDTQRAVSRVYAISEFDVPPAYFNATIGCEVSTPSRRAPSRRKLVHIYPYVPTESIPEAIHWSLKLDSEAHAVAQKRLNNSSLTVIYTNQGQATLNLNFWTNQEVGHSPACFLTHSNESTPVTNRTNHKVSLWRENYEWRCVIRFNTTVGPWHGRLSFGYGEDIHSFELIVTKVLLNTRPKVLGLHGNVFMPMKLICEENDTEEMKLLNVLGMHDNSNFTWTLERNRSTEQFTSHVNSLHFGPIHDKNNSHFFSHTGHAGQETVTIPPVNLTVFDAVSSELCVRCSVSYAFGVTSESERVCTQLFDFSTLMVNSEDIATGKESQNNTYLFMLLRQPMLSPNFILSEPEMNNTNASTCIAGFPLEIICLISPSSPDLTLTQFPVSLWPTVRFSTQSILNTIHEHSLRETTWFITTYSRGVKVTLNLTNANLNEEMIYCGFGHDEVQRSIRIEKPTSPLILEPTKSSLLILSEGVGRLKCLAHGLPAPQLRWEQLNMNHFGEDRADQWLIVNLCNDSIYQSNVTVCEHIANLKPTEDRLLLRCYATNFVDTVFSEEIVVTQVQSMSRTIRQALRPVRELHILYSLGVLIPCGLVFICALACFFYGRSVKNVTAGHFHRHKNALYTSTLPRVYCPKPSLSKEQELVVHSVASLLGSVEQAIYWTIPNQYLQLTDKRLGLGYYGQVCRGWLNPTCLLKRSNDVRRSVPADIHPIPVAVKTASGENSGQSCLRNEIELLSGLGEHPNIIRMYGLVVGTQLDLGDTSLVLAYCSHKSLSEFVRAHAQQILRHTSSRSGSCCNEAVAAAAITVGDGGNGVLENEVQLTKPQVPSSDSGVSSPNDSDTELVGHHNRKFSNEVNSSKQHEPSAVHQHDIHLSDKQEAVDYQLTVGDLYRIAWGIASGLVYLAESGVIHRDLATRNILISGSLTPKICDFGLAVRVSANSASTQHESYKILTHQKQLPFRILPPEALCEHTFYLASDVWEYGLLLWQLFGLETKKPFASVSSADELVKLLFATDQTVCSTSNVPRSLDRPQQLDDRLWDLMCRAWHLDYKSRPTAIEFEQLLHELLSHCVEESERQNEPTSMNCTPVTYTELIPSDLIDA
ncbi:hypothetical protein PHET_00325 [Paragonimus heterotremus]|uniref:Receptor protein-tyrosine kinase n=1 Tax=Paragonimus heterotremus TaxID=100268 RepID=A0A8J4STT2_9TREM|nr:hypothetical protein PHET_00325 [Paragonimus heterotremus]